jgi:peptide-methionine (S)-S-oxide reductase
MSIVFYHNDEQKRLAMETRDREAAKINGEIFTEIVPASEFYRAEAYHQKYRLRQVPDLMKEFSIIYPDNDDFVDSTVAARLNGYVGGHGTFEALRAELSGLGLSPERNKRLLDIVYAWDH